MQRRLILLGAGGNAYDVLDTVDAINAVAPTWDLVGVLDDNMDVRSEYLGIPVRGRLSSAPTFDDCFFVSTIWNEKVFRRLHEVLAGAEVDAARFATLIHPTASVSRRATFGRGVVVHQGASIAGNVTIEDQVSIGPGCILGHDSRVSSYTCIAAGAIISGGVDVERNCYIGSGAMIRQRSRIGQNALVGMGAIVVGNVQQGTTVVGNPARPILTRAT